MAKPIRVTTPQFRSLLIKKLKNLVPSCLVEFVEPVNSGIGFRLKDKQGNHLSGIIRIYRYREGILQKENLRRLVRNAGFTKK